MQFGMVFDICFYRFMHHSSFIAQIATKPILKEHISMDVIPRCFALVIVLLTVMIFSGKIYVHKLVLILTKILTFAVIAMFDLNRTML